jgi:hypothetical protein
LTLRAPPPLVLIAACSALALLIVGIVSQRTYAPMNINSRVSASHYGPYPLAFTMIDRPPVFYPHCDQQYQVPNRRCSWHLYLQDQTHEDRIRLLLHEGAGATNHSLWVRFGDGQRIEQPAPNATTAPPRGLWQSDSMRMLAIYASIFAVFGLLVLWRGRDAAVWLGLFCLCLAPFFLNFYGALTPDEMVSAWTAGVLLRSFAEFSLFAMALVLILPFLQTRTARALAALGFVLALASALLELLPKYEGIYRGYVDAWLNSARAPAQGITEILLLGVLPLALLSFGWYRAREPERSRLAVVAAVVALGVAGPIIDGAINGTDHFGGLTLLALAIPIGFTYAIPRYHVVDVGFIVNRIVVYALLIGIVSAAVALAEAIINDYARSPAEFFRELPRELPVGFVIVLGLRWVHVRLEDFVNQVLFRKRHKALNDLKAFIKRTDFAQTRDGLLRGAAQEIASALGARGVAIYEHERQSYRRIEHLGAFPQTVGEDDAAVWYMRAERQHIRLAGVKSAIGERGVAFPMCFRSSLYGMLVCGPRINEEYEGDYAPDEIDVMEELATRLAEQLFALAADDRFAFVNEIASGRLAGEALLERASQLRSSNGEHRKAGTGGTLA